MTLGTTPPGPVMPLALAAVGTGTLRCCDLGTADPKRTWLEVRTREIGARQLTFEHPPASVATAGRVWNLATYVTFDFGSTQEYSKGVNSKKTSLAFWPALFRSFS